MWLRPLRLLNTSSGYVLFESIWLKVLIAGGGIGGLAAALACTLSGHEVQLFEKAEKFSEVGAGVQLGPNVMRVLHGWGLAEAVQNIAAFPQQLQAREAAKGQVLGTLKLGDQARRRYGFAYATAHRADLHGVLLAALEQQPASHLHVSCAVEGFDQDAGSIHLHLADQSGVQGDLLIGADGLWSVVRDQMLHDGKPHATGHLAYRALVQQSGLPSALRSTQITAWLGPRMHVVQYPVRGGDWLNVVAVIANGYQGGASGAASGWDHAANAPALRDATAGVCKPLHELIDAIDDWRTWALFQRPAMRGPHEHAQNRVALLGDAAHPMLPYLAQGAGMAIEDAAELGRSLGTTADTDAPQALQRYAQARWQRNARVQSRSIRNGQIFHAVGPVAWTRNLSMRVLGERVMDLPWLYGHE